MNVVSLTHLNLRRARKQMEQAFHAGDWDAVKEWDALMTSQLTSAFDDPQRDNSRLVAELESVLELYAEMVSALPEAATQGWLEPSLVR